MRKSHISLHLLLTQRNCFMQKAKARLESKQNKTFLSNVGTIYLLFLKVDMSKYITGKKTQFWSKSFQNSFDVFAPTATDMSKKKKKTTHAAALCGVCNFILFSSSIMQCKTIPK